MTEPLQPAHSNEHARHDPELVAALAARAPDLSAVDLAAARALVERCTGCRDLLADLIALQVALPATSTPQRPREFALSAADARRLSGRGWRAVVGFFGSARDGFSRPLAIGFTTMGVVALLVTAAPSFQLGFATGGAPQAMSTDGGTLENHAAGAEGAAASAAPVASAAAASAAASAVPAPAAQSPASEHALPATRPASPPPREPAASGSYDRLTAEPYATAGEGTKVFNGEDDGSTDLLTGDAAGRTTGVDRGPALSIIVAGVCLIMGLGLFALRWTSRRFGEG